MKVMLTQAADVFSMLVLGFSAGAAIDFGFNWVWTRMAK